MILSSIFSWISFKSHGGGSKYMLCILAYALRWNLTTYNELIDKKISWQHMSTWYMEVTEYHTKIYL